MLKAIEVLECDGAQECRQSCPLQIVNEIEKLKDSPGPDGSPSEEELDRSAPESQASMSVPVSIPSEVCGAASSSSAGRRIRRKGFVF